MLAADGDGLFPRSRVPSFTQPLGQGTGEHGRSDAAARLTWSNQSLKAARWDRVSVASEGKGQTFELCRVRQGPHLLALDHHRESEALRRFPFCGCTNFPMDRSKALISFGFDTP